MSEATQLIPNWTLDDFMSERPYEWLYAQKDNKFMLQILLNKMQTLAKELKFSGFMKAWNAYVESKSPKATILGSNQTMFPKQPVQLDCGQYVADEYGVSRLNEMGAEVEVISHPLMPTRRVTNIETYEARMEIAFQRGKDPWKTIIVSREILASAQKIIGLAKNDISVNSENAKEVIKYISTLESLNYDELPRQNSVGHMGWLSDGRFMPYVDDITYDGEEGPEFDKIYRELKPTGDEDVWMDIARKTRSGDSVPARIVLAAGFAAPLVQLLDAQSFFVHIWGDKGCGKSVGLMLAASIWGNPDIGGLAKTFSGTKVSFELMSAFCCNIPVMLDELQVVNDNRKNFDDIIYMLCEGASKGRGAKGGGLQLQRRWRTTIITTGETPIIQSNSGGGAAVRTIEVNFKNTPLFHDDQTAREYAGLLKKNYGFAGKKFVEALYRPEVIDALRKLQDKYYNELAGEIDGKQVLSASILLAADALATMAIFKDGKNLTSEELKEFLITKDESDANLRCYNWLIGFCAANPRRFDSADNNNGVVWGQYKDGYVFINKSTFEDILKDKGYSYGAFVNWARNRGILKCQFYGKGNKNNRPTWPISVNGRNVPHYGIKLPEEEKTEQEEYREYVKVNDPDMPF